MVKSTLTATIFVSSPGDVADERESVSTTVARWNSRNSDSRGVTFNIWTWENNSVPDYGVDAQEVMNRQIPSDYDILLGIFWTRLGTPTGRFGSGTQEEIEDAIGRRGTTGNPHVAIYFKKGRPNLSDIDIDQLSRLRTYEATIKARSLAGQFDVIEEFEAQVERLLDKKAHEYRNGSPQDFGRIASQTENPNSEEDDPYADYGLFDVVEKSEEALKKATDIMSAISQRMGQFSGRIEVLSERLNDINRFGDATIKQKRPIVQEAAHEMNIISDFLESKIDDFLESFSAASDMAVLAVDVSVDFEDAEENANTLRESVRQIVNSGDEAILAQRTLRDTIASLPRLDVATNQAKRRLSGVIDRLTDAMAASILRMRDI